MVGVGSDQVSASEYDAVEGVFGRPNELERLARPHTRDLLNILPFRPAAPASRKRFSDSLLARAGRFGADLRRRSDYDWVAAKPPFYERAVAV